MKDHIAQTIAELEARREKLKKLISELRSLSGGAPEETGASHPPRPRGRAPAAEPAAPALRRTDNGAPERILRHRCTAETAVVYELCKNAEEPFAAADIIRRARVRLPDLGEEKAEKLVRNFVLRFESAGHLEKASTERPFKYSRGPSFDREGERFSKTTDRHNGVVK